MIGARIWISIMRPVRRSHAYGRSVALWESGRARFGWTARAAVGMWCYIYEIVYCRLNWSRSNRLWEATTAGKHSTLCVCSACAARQFGRNSGARAGTCCMPSNFNVTDPEAWVFLWTRDCVTRMPIQLRDATNGRLFVDFKSFFRRVDDYAFIALNAAGDMFVERFGARAGRQVIEKMKAKIAPPRAPHRKELF